MHKKCPMADSLKKGMARRRRLLSVMLAGLGLCGCAAPPVAGAPSPAPSFPTPSEPAALIEMQVVTTPVPTAIPTPVPEPLPFSIIWFPDTQVLSYGYPEALSAMGAWVAENTESENIRYVVHTGDITDNGFKTWQWDNFDLCYGQFRDTVPYLPVAGNHDLGVKLGDYSAYLERPFFAAFPPENLYEGGKALYAELQTSGVKLLLIGACWGAELEAVEWMQEVIAAHADYDAVILLFHAYIRADGTYMPIGAEMYDQLVLPYPNVRLVLSGHVKGRTGVRIEEIDDDGDGNPDRKVNALMYNHNQSTGRHAGFFRILNFDPVLRTITVTTYSPFSGLYYRDDYFKNTVFTLENAF